MTNDLMPSYDGGCPSRFCKPDGYDNCAGKGIVMNKTGLTYEGTLINLPTRVLSPNVERLIFEIGQRMTYG